jgi:acyl-CoA hydrolase
MMVTDEAVKANLRVGLLLEVLDKLAEETALRFVRALHPEARVVTAAKNLLLARDLVVSGWERTYPEYENVPQKIFGGYVVHRAYMSAHICAEMVAGTSALLIACDRIDFYQPVRMGDKLHFVSGVTFTGRTSLSVETTITRISRDRKSTALSNTCVFTFMNVDPDLNLLPVPQIYPATFAEDERYLAGHRRRLRRQLSATCLELP